METNARVLNVGEFRNRCVDDPEELFFEITSEGETSTEPRVFVFLLDEELKFLDNETHWLHHMERAKSYIVRCQAADFKDLEIGKHPKTLIFHNKRSTEIANYNGIPTQAELTAAIRRINYESSRKSSS